MGVEPGSQLGPYRILEKLGEGGMGEVWAALDTRLDRRVALKVLPARLAADRERRQRFEQEAKAIASLNHPSIVTIFSIEEHDGLSYLTMELVRGRTLATTIPAGGMAIEQFLDIAVQLAEALHAAHEQGVIHGDLKPANIMVTSEGRTKILDFGLAKLRARLAPARPPLQNAAESGIRESIITGSLPYLSPEQADGLEQDQRSDLFSFGVILYQMLSGVSPFRGSTPVEKLLSIVEDEPPPLPALDPSLPRSLTGKLERCITRCLRKDPRRRTQSAGELLAQLTAIGNEVELGHITSSRILRLRLRGRHLSSRLKMLRAMAAVLVLLGIAAVLQLAGSRGSSELSLGRTRRLTVEAGEEAFPALSPDGRLLAYVAGPPGERHLMVRQVAGGHALRLTGDLDPGRTWEWPSWSPDGTRLLFSSLGDSAQVWMAPALGGPPRLVLELLDLYTCAAWSPSGGQIAYVHQGAIWLREFDEAGPGRQLAVVPDAHFLAWSPDGSHIACISGNRRFLSFGNIAPSSVCIVAVDSGAVVAVTDGKSMAMSPVWSPDSRKLLFLNNREGSNDLYQVAVDRNGVPVGPPRRLTTGLNAKSISLAADGSALAYSVCSRTANIWRAPYPDGPATGTAAAQPVTSGSQIIEAFAVSSDGAWLVFDSNRNGNQDIFRMRLPDGEPEQLTSDPADDWGPRLSPDGRHLAFYSVRTGNRDIFVMAMEDGTLQQITSSEEQERYPDWSPDGSRLVFDRPDSASLWVVELDEHGAAGEPRQLPFSGGFLRAARWSPDGEHIACPTSDAIHLVPLDGGEPRVLVRRGDASVPVPWAVAWSHDGATLYYKSYSKERIPSIWELPLSSDVPRLLIDLEIPAPMTVGPDFDFDGRYFYFTQPQTEGDIWLADLQ